MDISSVSKQEMQSPGAVSRLESTRFSLDDLESEDTWSPVVLGLPATMSLMGSAGPPVGLEEGLGDSHHGCLESVLLFGVG